jgi:hypothetical protein
MCKYAQQFLAPPTFDDDEQNRIVAILYPISLIVLSLGILTATTALFLYKTQAAGALLFVILGSIGSVLLSRRYQLKGAILLLLLIILGVLDFLVYSDGTHDIALIAYPALIIVSGLLLDSRTFIAYVALIIMSLMILVIGEITGLFVNRLSEYTSFGDLIYLLCVLVSTAALARLLSKGIIENVNKVHLAKLALKEKNRELHQANDELNHEVAVRICAETEREKLIVELQEALKEISVLDGLLPICASCKKIRDDEGYWHQVEAYIKNHSTAEFSHGFCPACYQIELDKLTRSKPKDTSSGQT